MMQSPRYARLNPFGGFQRTAGPISEEPLQFSNSISDSAYNPAPSSHVSDESLSNTSKKQRLMVKNRSVSGTADGLPYTGFDPNVDLRSPS
jgi:hypothetical protein